MKKHPALPLCALLVALSLPSCTQAQPPSPPLPSETTPDTAGEEDAAASLRAAYEARLASLESELLSAKESSYIAKAEYEARISALMKEIAALKAALDLQNSPDNRPDLPVSGKPAETSPVPDPPAQKPASMAFRYEIREGRAVILAYEGNETRVTIPAVIEGYPVTAIEEAAFRDTCVVSVTVPYPVSEIGWFAFADCTSLTSVTLPASVETIGYAAFDGCPLLTLYCPADSYAARYAVSFGLPQQEAYS